MSSSLMIPTVHLNGTSHGDLMEQLDEAIRGMVTAMALVQESAPNGRDYYVQGADATGKAQEQHIARLTKLREVRDELEAMRLAVYDQRRKEKICPACAASKPCHTHGHIPLDQR
jgi:hypothetical protein